MNKLSKKIISLVFFALIILGACTPSKLNSKLDQERERLLKSESFRFNLNNTESAPIKPAFPKVIQTELKNGLKIFVVEDNKLPIVEVNLVFKNGSAFDQKDKSGLLDFCMQMLKEGAGSLNSLELAEAFANLGTELSVGTTKDSSFMSVAVLSNKVDETIKLLASMAQEPRFELEDFSRLKTQIHSSLAAQKGNPGRVAAESFLKTAYGPAHPYASPVDGTLAGISNIQLEDIKKTQQNYFGPNNAALVVVGDVSLTQIKKIAQQYFSKWKKITEPKINIPAPLAKKSMHTVLVERKNAPQAYLIIGQPVSSKKDPDLAALEVLQRILAGLPTSRLDANLREKKGWTYGVQSSLSPLKGLGPMLVSTSVQLPFGSDAIQEILNEFDKLKNTAVSAEELKIAKNGLLHSFANRYNTVSQIATSIAQQFVYDLPLNYDESLYDKIAQVSDKDIMTAAKKALSKEKLVAVAVGELDALKIPIAKMDFGVVSIEQ